MPLSKRQSPYIWVTWLSSLLTGQSSCYWASWFKAHYQYVKEPSNMDFTGWQIRHTEMIQQAIANINNDYDGEVQIYVEDDNSFSIKGKQSGAIIAGKPDIVAIPNAPELRPFILDCKSGNPNDSHKMQVLTYLYFVSQADELKRTYDGLLLYRDDNYVTIPNEQMDLPFKTRLLNTIKDIAGNSPARKSASFNECRFCNITVEDCPEKITGETSFIESADF